MVIRHTTVSLATLRPPPQPRPAATRYTSLRRTPLRTSTCRDVCQATMQVMIRSSLTHHGFTTRNRPTQTGDTRCKAVDMGAARDREATTWLPGGTRTTVNRRCFRALHPTSRECRPVALRRTRAPPRMGTDTLVPQANRRTTPSNMACRNRRRSRTSRITL